MAKPSLPREPQTLFQPWIPPKANQYEHACARAVSLGTATPDQQRDFMKFLVERVCGAYEEQFCPGEDGRRATDYALGKRRVALYLVSLVNTDPKKFHPDAAPGEQS